MNNETIEPAQRPAVFWVLFDPTGPEKFIKKMMPEGFLAFFDNESDARRAKAQNPGTDFKRVEYFKALPAQQSQWVPSSKRLPPLDIPVWLSDEGRGVFIGMRSSSTDGWLWAECDAYRFFGGQWESIEAHFDDFEPTYWMPLPSAPGDTAAPEQAEQDAVMVPDGITIERDMRGTLHIKLCDFDFIQIQYQYPHTDNSSTRRLAERIAALLAGGDA